MKGYQMQIIGLCRFSYLGLGGFQMEHETIEARAAFLYEPARLLERFATFETFTLPCIAAQTDPDFTFVVVTGESLPDWAYNRLHALTAGIPQIQLKTLPPLRHRPAMRRVISAALSPGDAPSVQFRLDDDDAVALTFVERLRAAAHKAKPLMEEAPLAIDFNQGYLVKASAEGLQTAPIQQPYWTAGLAIMFPPNFDKCVMSYGHHKVAKEMTTLTFTGEDMMIRGLNDYNDSRPDRHVNQARFSVQTPQEQAHFRKTYGIDPAHLRRVFTKLNEELSS